MVRMITAALAIGAFALFGITAQPLSAGWCGGGGGGASAGGSAGGGGGGGGGIGRQGTPSKLGRAGSNGGTVRRTGGGAPAVDPDSIPSWERPSSETLESAALEERPLVIWFPEEGETDADFADKDLAEMSKSDAVFIKIPYTEDREASPWAEESIVPTSKLLSDNPSRDYDIPVGRSTVLITDSYGNEYFRLNDAPKADRLKSYIEKVKDEVEDANEKLQKYLDKAREELDAGDRSKALKYLLKNFDKGEGPVGLEAQEESIRLYHDIMDDVRDEMEDLIEAGDVDGLKSLEKEVKKTDLEKEIEEAIDELK